MMSSFPSLSQSMNPTPPLIDSMMYLFSGEERCETVKPACLLTSSNLGIGGPDAGVWAKQAIGRRRQRATMRMRAGQFYHREPGMVLGGGVL
jgi:hypothetical protein